MFCFVLCFLFKKKKRKLSKSSSVSNHVLNYVLSTKKKKKVFNYEYMRKMFFKFQIVTL